MKNITISILATTLFFISCLAYWEWTIVSAVPVPPADQITANSYEILLNMCRGDLEGDGYTVYQNFNPTFSATGTLQIVPFSKLQ